MRRHGSGTMELLAILILILIAYIFYTETGITPTTSGVLRYVFGNLSTAP